MHGLDDNGALVFAASSASRDLADKLEGAFGGAEIGLGEGGVGVDDADQSHVREIETLGDHLRAQEELEVAFGEAVEDGEVVGGFADGIGIEAGEVVVFFEVEEVGEFVLDALDAEAEQDDFAFAGGALLGD